MNQEAQNIQKQIQELENLANEMLDANNSDYETFEQISQQIQEYQLQQRKLADEAKYLEEVDIQRIYEENGGKEPISFADGITDTQSSLDQHFGTFIEGNEQSRIVFVNQDTHWMTVRLEKVNEGIVYQVADSTPENPTNNKSNREERIDTLLGGICTKIPFKSEEQQNDYDCGIFCALNAVDMKSSFTDSNAKSTHSQNDVDTIRKNFEKGKVSQQKPQQTESNATQTNSYKPSKAKEEFFEKLKKLPEEVRDIIRNESKIIRNESKKIPGYSEHIFQSVVKAYNNYTKQQKQSNRLSSASSNYSNKSNLHQLKNLQSQRSSLTSSPLSNISMTSHSNELKRQPSAIQNHNNNKQSKGFNM